MTLHLDIAEVYTQARLVGPKDKAAAVERQLARVLEEQVMPRVASALNLPDGTILRMPYLSLKLRITLQELERGDCADHWASEILAAVGEGRDVWRFADEATYLAAYLYHRIGLCGYPDDIFPGFETLNLMQPLRAMGELVRKRPDLWQPLVQSDGGPQSIVLLRAMRAQGGAFGVAALIADLVQPHADWRRGMVDVMAVRAALWACDTAFGRAVSSARWPATDVWHGLDMQGRVLLMTLLIAPHVNPEGLIVASTIAGVIATRGWAGATDERSEGGELSGFARALVHAARRDDVAAAQIQALQKRIAAAVHGAPPREKAAQVNEVSKSAAQATKPDGLQNAAAARSAESAADNASARRHFASSLAGVALVLPYLCEGDIGSAYPVTARLQALAILVGADVLPKPEESAFLLALTGAEGPDKDPTRPDAFDLAFVPEARRREILATEAGPARLAQWLAARFASGLSGLGHASLPFLQRQFFHMAGEVWIDPKGVWLRVDPMPLLPVLTMAGRLGRDVSRIGWLGGLPLDISVGDAP